MEFKGCRPAGGCVGSAETSTPADGTFRVPVDANSEVEYWAKKGSIETTHMHLHSCDGGGEIPVGDIVLGGSTGTGVAKITLIWGPQPSDLDAHLTVPKSDGTWAHVYWPVITQVVEDSILDTDAQAGNGPEITTILKGHEGKYRFSVHHYAGTGATMAASGAIVTVQASGLPGVRTFTPPANATAVKDAWHVFDLTYHNGLFTLTPLGDVLSGVDSHDITKFQP